ncbi:MAG: STAS domain-containing protein [Oscillospiraceae bacterium]|nr:STAS domain-containing protein [Oscillospiraceae bacterium]
MDNLQELRELVNPVVNTAKSCLDFDAKNGDPDSQRLLDILGFTAKNEENAKKVVPPEMMAVARRLTPVFSTYVESRFHGVNRLLLSMPERTIVDLPCGYTARGVKMSHAGRTYFGFDLPAVIDVLAPAMEKIIGRDEAIRYAAVDATNYKTLEAPLTGTTAPLVITTEGMLMYLTQPELEEVFTNIHKLLLKHSGSWILVDRTYHRNEQRIAEAMLNGDQEALAMFKVLGARGAGTMADIKTYNNSFFTDTDDEVKAFLKRMGFRLREIPMSDYLPECISSLKELPQVEPAVRDVFKTMYFWELTVSEGTDKKEKANLPFAVEASFQDGRFSAAIQGRMDTLTAPELLQKFQALPEKAAAIEIDVENMSYVSSAGLRVLLMMYKTLEDKSRFKLLNVSDEVKEILEVTGFDQFLLT